MLARTLYCPISTASPFTTAAPCLAQPVRKLPNRPRRAAARFLLNEQTGGRNLWERMWIATELRRLEE